MYQLRGGCRSPGDMVVRIRTVLPGYNAELVLRGVLQCFLCVVYQHTQPETWCSGGVAPVGSGPNSSYPASRVASIFPRQVWNDLWRKDRSDSARKVKSWSH